MTALRICSTAALLAWLLSRADLRGYEWLKRHRAEFFWGVLDGFEIGG